MGNDAPDDFGKSTLQDRESTSLFLTDEFGTGECDDFGIYRVFDFRIARVSILGWCGFPFPFYLTRSRHSDELVKEVPSLKTLKDWIAADLKTWDKVLTKEGDGSYIVNVSEEELKKSSSKRNKK